MSAARRARSSSAASILVLAAIGAAASGCSKKDTAGPDRAGSPTVARVGDTAITVRDVEQRIQGQAAFMRARYAAPEKKRELLDEMVRFEVLAGEAQRRGYDKDPEVVRAMKQQMIAKLMERDFESKVSVADVPDADVEKYYQGHPDEFHKKDEVRIGEIVVADEAKAQKVYAEVKALPPNAGGDPRGFRDLVVKYSEDGEAKRRGAERLFFDQDSTAYPKAVVEAAFQLRAVGDVSAPVKTDGGWAIVELAQKRPGFDRPLADVTLEIQQRLFRDLRAHALDAFIADLTQKTKTEIHDDVLSQVVVPDVAGAAARSRDTRP